MNTLLGKMGNWREPAINKTIYSCQTHIWKNTNLNEKVKNK